jgi:hypothetical protein
MEGSSGGGSTLELSDGALARGCFIIDRAELCEPIGITLAALAEAAGRTGESGVPS